MSDIAWYLKHAAMQVAAEIKINCFPSVLQDEEICDVI